MEQFECISVQQAQQKLADGKALLVDIRDPQSLFAGSAYFVCRLTNHYLPLFPRADEAQRTG